MVIGRIDDRAFSVTVKKLLVSLLNASDYLIPLSYLTERMLLANLKVTPRLTSFALIPKHLKVIR